VVGLPISFGGAKSRQAEEVEAFVGELKKTVQLPISLEDERFTSKIAERHTPKEKADASAAALILQSYLDKQDPNP